MFTDGEAAGKLCLLYLGNGQNGNLALFKRVRGSHLLVGEREGRGAPRWRSDLDGFGRLSSTGKVGRFAGWKVLLGRYQGTPYGVSLGPLGGGEEPSRAEVRGRRVSILPLPTGW